MTTSRDVAAIHRPNYPPWLGNFHKFAGADIFVFLDDGSIEFRDRDRARDAVLFFRLPDDYGLGSCSQIAPDQALDFGYRAPDHGRAG